MYSKYQGKFDPKKFKKYSGSSNIVEYRSGWELSLMIWLDNHPNVVSWSSEEVVIPYRCKSDGKMHNYFVDFKISMNNGEVYLVEVKPKAQMAPPKGGKGKSKKRLIEEAMTYAKNVSKWKAAKEYAEDRNYKFQVWNEDTLVQKGVKLIGKLPNKS